MAKVKFDVCDICNEVVTKSKGGIEISGQNIAITWVGKNSPDGDPFKNAGIHVPMDGRVTITICKSCLIKELKINNSDFLDIINNDR